MTQERNRSRLGGSSDSGTQPKPVTPPPDPKPFPTVREERGIQRQMTENLTDSSSRKK